MKKDKAYLKKWLNEFVMVMCELSGSTSSFDILAVNSCLKIPVDVFAVLVRRRVFKYSSDGGFHYLEIQFGDEKSFVKVEPDPKLKNGLDLKIGIE